MTIHHTSGLQADELSVASFTSNPWLANAVSISRRPSLCDWLTPSPLLGSILGPLCCPVSLLLVVVLESTDAWSSSRQERLSWQLSWLSPSRSNNFQQENNFRGIRTNSSSFQNVLFSPFFYFFFNFFLIPTVYNRQFLFPAALK